MTWLDTLTSTPVLIAGALGITAAVYAKRNPTTIPSAGQMSEQAKEVAQATQAEGTQAKVAQAVRRFRRCLWKVLMTGRIGHVPAFCDSRLAQGELACRTERDARADGRRTLSRSLSWQSTTARTRPSPSMSLSRGGCSTSRTRRTCTARERGTMSSPGRMLARDWVGWRGVSLCCGPLTDRDVVVGPEGRGAGLLRVERRAEENAGSMGKLLRKGTIRLPVVQVQIRMGSWLATIGRATP